MTQYTVSGYTHSLLECENTFLRACIDEQDRIITSYQIAKDNLELRLARAVLANEKPIVGTFAGHWTY